MPTGRLCSVPTLSARFTRSAPPAERPHRSPRCRPVKSSHRWPKFLPDGRTLLYFVQGTEPGVYLTTLDRPGDTKRVFNSASDATYVPGQRNSPGYLLWVARDTVMAQPFDPAVGAAHGIGRGRAWDGGRRLIRSDEPCQRVGVERRHAALQLRRVPLSVGVVRT